MSKLARLASALDEWHAVDDTDTTEANALHDAYRDVDDDNVDRLIAAAPDLLAACRIAAETLTYLADDETNQHRHSDAARLASLEAAIAKATGK